MRSDLPQESGQPAAHLLALHQPASTNNNNLTWPFVGRLKTFLPPSPRNDESSDATIFLQISKEESRVLRTNPFEDLELIRAAIFESSPGIFYERSAKRIVVLDEHGELLYDFQPHERNMLVKEKDRDAPGVLFNEEPIPPSEDPHQVGFPNPGENKFRDPEEEIEDRILNRREMAHLFQWYYPEGGWGIVILIVSVLNQILCQGLHFSMGFPLSIYIRDHFKDVQPFHIGCLMSMSLIVSNVISIFIVAFCRKKSTRLIAVIGGLVLALGTLFTSFITQFHQLFISYGIVIAIGVSMIRDSSMLMIGQYFKKNRQVTEIFFVGSMGIGLSFMSSLIYLFIGLYKWRIGLQIVTILVGSSFILGTFFRSASLYHPQRRAILHLKSRKVFKDKCKTLPSSCPYFDFSAFQKSKNVQILVLSAAISSAGFLSPLLLIVFDASNDGFHPDDILLFNINLGLGWSLGCCLFGVLIRNMSEEECRIPIQYICQSCLIVGGISVFLFAISVQNSSGYYIFVWIYGMAIGGFQYTIKMAIYQKVRSRNFSQTWSLLQLIQGLPTGIILSLTCYLNWKFSNKCGYYLSGGCLFLGCISLYFITLRKNFVRSKDKSKSKRTISFNADLVQGKSNVQWNGSPTLGEGGPCEQTNAGDNEEDGNEEEDENEFAPHLMNDIHEITSCSKVERNILPSEIEEALTVCELPIVKGDTETKNSNFFLSIVDYKLVLKRNSVSKQSHR